MNRDSIQVAADEFVAASLRAETGITSSAAHAEADAPGWSDHAMALLGRYIQARNGVWVKVLAEIQGVLWREEFTVEQFRLWAYEHGLSRPSEERCWGSVTQKALRQGLIVKVGYAAAASSNNSPKATYRGVV